MTMNERFDTLAPIAVGIGHVVVVLGVMGLFGYPITAFNDGTGLLEVSSQVIGLFLLAFIPALLLRRVRLIIPISLVSFGFGGAILAEFLTPGPEFGALDGHTLTVGSSYLGMYADGWYVWLFACLLGGLCEYGIRWVIDGTSDPPIFRGINLPFGWRHSVLCGGVVGILHAAIFVALGIEREGMILSGLLLGWALGGAVLLGGVVTLLLVRYQLLTPLVVFVFIVIATGIEASSTAVGTPVSSYLLFWPVYVIATLIVAVGEYVFRRVGRIVTTYRRASRG